MSETVKNKHMKKKNSIGLVFKTIITVFLLFLTGYGVFPPSSPCVRLS